MDSVQIDVKLYVDDREPTTVAEFIPVFHDWIKDRRLEEVMIDVTDYSHVHHGPGVLLICHEAQYGMDLDEGRLGLRYARKRGTVTSAFGERLVEGLRRALTACNLLENDGSIQRPVRFGGAEMLLRIPDRLRAPNSDETMASVRADLDRVLTQVYGEGAYTIAREGSERGPFTVRVTGRSAVSVDELLARLAA